MDRMSVIQASETLKRPPTPFAREIFANSSEEDEEEWEIERNEAIEYIPLRKSLDASLGLVLSAVGASQGDNEPYMGFSPTDDRFYRLPSPQRRLQSIDNLASYRTAVRPERPPSPFGRQSSHFIISPAAEYFSTSPQPGLTIRRPQSASASQAQEPWITGLVVYDESDAESEHSSFPSFQHIETVTRPQKNVRPDWVKSPGYLLPEELKAAGWLLSDPGKLEVDRCTPIALGGALKWVPQLQWDLLAEHHEGNRVWRLWTSTKDELDWMPRSSSESSREKNGQRQEIDPKELPRFSCSVMPIRLAYQLRRLSSNPTEVWSFGKRVTRYLDVREPKSE